jgi:hypothetical protein
MSLSRSRDNQGQAPQALELLQGTQIWFTEGFETADPKEAQTLLGELA